MLSLHLPGPYLWVQAGTRVSRHACWDTQVLRRALLHTHAGQGGAGVARHPALPRGSHLQREPILAAVWGWRRWGCFGLAACGARPTLQWL